MRTLADGLRPLLQHLVDKHGPVATWPTGASPAPPACERCQDQGWLNCPHPNPHASVPIYRAAPCPDCNGALAAELPWRRSGICPEERARCTFAGFDLRRNPAMRPALEAARMWATGGGAPFLVLAGPKGTGKTHLALAAAGQCLDRGEQVAYEIVPDLFDRLRATQRPAVEEDEERQASLEQAKARCYWPVLVLDDLGVGRDTEFVTEQLYSMVNERWRRRLRTVVTTNMPPGRVEPRIYSRLVDSALSRVVECAGRDLREEV